MAIGQLLRNRNSHMAKKGQIALAQNMAQYCFSFFDLIVFLTSTCWNKVMILKYLLICLNNAKYGDMAMGQLLRNRNSHMTKKGQMAPAREMAQFFLTNENARNGPMTHVFRR